MPANPRTLLVEQAYRDALLTRALQTAQAINSRFALVNRDDLTASFQAMVPQLAALIALGQRDAQVLAQTFLTSLSESERGSATPLAASNPQIAGTTVDGRSIAQVVSGFIPAVFIALRRGVPLETALNIGRYGVWRVAMTEVTEAAHREVAHQGLASGDLIGWTWVTGGKKPCGACLSQQNGRVRPFSQPMKRHAGCSCIESPVYAGDTGAVKRPTGLDRFRAMTRQQQDETFR